MSSSFFRYLDHAPQSLELLWTSDKFVAETFTQQHTTLIREKYPLPTAEFERVIPACERPQTHVLDHAATGTGI
jgi:hypothetical protein